MAYDKITISGQICTGKTTLYKALGQKLGWETFSTGAFFRDYAAKHNLDLESGEEQNEKITKKIDYQVRDLLKTRKNIVVEGWLSGIMAEGIIGVLKILLVCDAKKRQQRFGQREQVSHKEAASRVKERDTSWLAEIKKIYNRADVFDPKHYDLIIDTTDQEPEAIQEQVLRIVQKN